MKYQIKYILFIIIFVSTIKSEEIIIDYEEEKEYNAESFNNNNSTFKIIKTKNLNCLKIEVEGKGKNKDTNHIISFYSEPNSTERNQLSQSLTGKTFMWLIQSQLQNDVYLEIECAETPCDYKLTLENSSDVELFLNEPYTYYVTEDNANMTFRLLSNQTDLNLRSDWKYFVGLWVKGNKEISSTLIEKDEKKSIPFRNYYMLPYPQITEYLLTINAKEGDLINIGLILFRQGADMVILPEIEFINGMEFTGYLRDKERLYIEKKDLKPLKNYYIFENKGIDYVDIANFFGLELKNSEYEDAFYSFQYINNTKYENKGNNIYYPQLDGIYNFKTIEEGTSIGIIPMKPNDNFTYLTYEVLPKNGEIEVSIFNCNNYPLCNINEATKDPEIISSYKSFHISYSKYEYSEDISPISQNQKMLLINCKKGIKRNNNIKNICSAYINMRTDNKEINITNFIKENQPFTRFIRKDNTDKYSFKGTNNPIYLYIETFSGEINVEISPEDDYKKVEIDNKKLYTIPENKNISVTIKGEENSVYTIYDNYNLINNPLKIGSNYLFNLEEDQLFLKYSKEIFDTLDETEDYKYLLGIYPLHCSINVKRIEIEVKNNINLTDDNNFYQEILDSSLSYSLNLSRLSSGNNTEPCLFYLSLFKLENSISTNTGIPLGYNVRQSFRFNKNNGYSLAFSYSLTKLENDLEFSFNLLNKSNYEIIILANNNKIKKETFKDNNKIILTSKQIKDGCGNLISICKIALLIEFTDNKKDSEYTLQININNYLPEKKENDEDDNKLLMILCISGIAILVVIGFIVFIILKTFKKGKELNKEVTQISFQDSEANDRNEENDNIDTLLG